MKKYFTAYLYASCENEREDEPGRFLVFLLELAYEKWCWEFSFLEQRFFTILPESEELLVADGVKG